MPAAHLSLRMRLRQLRRLLAAAEGRHLLRLRLVLAAQLGELEHGLAAGQPLAQRLQQLAAGH